jgi:hypothetical protein
MFLQEQQKNLGRVIAKAWSDPDFKARLKTEPRAVLIEMGVEPPVGVQIEVVENTVKKAYLTLPAAPSPEILSDAELEALVSPGGHPMALYTQHSPHSCCTSNMGCCG